MHAVVGSVWKSNPWSAAYRQENLAPSERVVGWLSGSCLLLKRSAFDAIAGFDERYFMYMEDVDLGESSCQGRLGQRLRAGRRGAARQGSFHGGATPRVTWPRTTGVPIPFSPIATPIGGRPRYVGRLRPR